MVAIGVKPGTGSDSRSGLNLLVPKACGRLAAQFIAREAEKWNGAVKASGAGAD